MFIFINNFVFCYIHRIIKFFQLFINSLVNISALVIYIFNHHYCFWLFNFVIINRLLYFLIQYLLFFYIFLYFIHFIFKFLYLLNHCLIHLVFDTLETFIQYTLYFWMIIIFKLLLFLLLDNCLIIHLF